MNTNLPWKYSVNVGPTKALIVDEDGYTVLELENKFRDGKRFEAIVRGIVEDHNAQLGSAECPMSDEAARPERRKGVERRGDQERDWGLSPYRRSGDDRRQPAEQQAQTPSENECICVKMYLAGASPQFFCDKHGLVQTNLHAHEALMQLNEKFIAKVREAAALAARVQQLTKERDHWEEIAEQHEASRRKTAEAEAASLKHDIARHVAIAAEATNEAASLRRDAERMDYLEKYAVIRKPGQSIRAAIDAEIAKGQG